MPGRLRLGPHASVDPADLHIEFTASSGPGDLALCGTETGADVVVQMRIEPAEIDIARRSLR